MLCYEIVTVSAVRFTVHRLITRGSGGCESYLVSGWLRLPLVPGSVRWHWDKGPLYGLWLGPQIAGLVFG